MQNIFHDVWRKKYKGLLLIIGVVGIVIIFSLEWIVNKFGISTDYTFGDKISNSILFLTGVIITWYTRETFDLKVLQRKELEELRKQTDFELRPYLRLQLADENNESKVFYLVNEGRGLALDVKFERFIFDNQVIKTSFLIKSRPMISKVTTISSGELAESYKGDLDIVENIKKGIRKFIEGWIQENFIIKATYKDIEKNEYLVIFKSDKSYNDKFKIEFQDRKDK